jgi:hypothetical protein
MNAVSTRIEGTSGDLSTAKLACSTCALCSVFTWPSAPSTALPSRRLWSMVAVWERSSSVCARYLSLTSMFTPPTRSASFSFFASQRAASEVARRSDSANTLEPRAFARMKRSACTETNRSGLHARALFDAGLERNVEVAVARQHRAHVGLGVDELLQALRDRQRDVLLARAQPPRAPGSSPPCPGSMTMVARRATLAGGGRAAARDP